jgi:hypothetical protein
VAVAAEAAIRAWINSHPALTGKGRPLPRGCFEGREIRSPAHGAYALLYRDPGVTGQVCAEDAGPSRCRVTAHVFAGRVDVAETAAVALANAWAELTGSPQPCGETGVLVLVADNVADPGFVPPQAAGGEVYEFTTGADFILYQP